MSEHAPDAGDPARGLPIPSPSRGMLRTPRARLALPAFLLLPVLFFLVPPILQGRIFFHEDLETYFYGLRGELRRMWLEGALHGWNPAVSGGITLLGDLQLAAFYPLNLFFYWMDPGPAFNLYFLTHFLLGSLLGYRFLRSLDLSALPAVAGTLIYLWSGFFWAHLHHVTFLAAGIWLPGMLEAWDRLLKPDIGPRRGGPRLALMVGMAALAGGSPQILYYELLTLAAYALVTLRLDRSSSSSSGAVLGASALAVTLGLGLAAIELWPFYLASRLKYEEVLPPLQYSSSFALSPLALARLLVPNLFGNDFYSLEGRGYLGPGTYWESWCYLGVLTLPLVALGMRVRGRPGFFTGLFCLSLVGCLGMTGGLHILLATLVPLYARFRAPSRLFMLTGLAAGALCGYALEALMQRAHAGRAEPGEAKDDPAEARHANDPSWRPLTTAGKFTLVLGLELWVICGMSLFLRDQPLHRVAAIGWGLALLNLLTVWIFLRAVRNGRFLGRALTSSAVGGGALLLLFVDLMPVLWTYNKTVAAGEATRIPAVVAAITGQVGHERILSDRTVPPYLLNGGTDFGYRNVRGYNPLNPRRWVEFLQAADDSGPREGGISALVEKPLSPMLELLAPTLQVTREPRAAARFEQRYFDAERKLYLFHDTRAMPRAWLTGTVRLEPDVPAVLKASREAVASRPPPLVLNAPGEGLPALDPAAVAASSLAWKRDGRDEVGLEVLAAGPVALVLADGFAPGWRAEIDGREAAILPAFHALRAVLIPTAGRHEVVFRYVTPGLVIGAWISAASGVLLLAWMVVNGRRARVGSLKAQG